MRRPLVHLFGLIGLVLSIAIAPTGAHAQTDAATVARRAIEFLKTQLPKPFPGVDSYTFTPENFADAGLGCAAKGQTFAPVPTPGYRFRLTVKGVIYEVHTNLDGSSAVLCDSADVKIETALGVYRTPRFSLSYPEKWQVAARDPNANEVFLGVSSQQVCSQPGMIVNLLGKQAAGKTADQLLDDYLAANKTQSPAPNSERATLGYNGRSVLLLGACTDGSPRAFRVSAYVAFGQGYRLIQYTPGAAFNQWAALYQKIATDFSPSATGNAPSVVAQPDGAPGTLLIHQFNGNLYAAALGDLPGTPITRDSDNVSGTRLFTRARLSPDGKRIAFTEPASKTLYTAGITKNPAPVPILGVKVADSPFAPAWSPDSQQIVYLSDENPLTLRAIDLAGNQRLIAKLELSACTNRAPTSPAAALLAQERNADLLLEWASPTLIVMARNCSGLGVLKIDVQTGTVEPIPQPIARARLSPDKQRLIGLTLGKVGTYDLAAQSAQVMDISADQVVWAADGSTFYYTTRLARAPLKLAEPTAGFAAFESNSYELTIHSVGAAGQDTLLYQGEGFAIGAIAAHPNGIAFTLIQSEAALIEGLTRTQNRPELDRLVPVSQLYWLPNGAQAPILLANTLQPQFGPPGSAAVIGVPIAAKP